VTTSLGAQNWYTSGMPKQRLDKLLADRGLVGSRSQAESYIKLGYVTVEGKKAFKPGEIINGTQAIKVTVDEQYVSRAALKLAGAAKVFGLDFNGKQVLDVGGSTGGFTDYALKNRASAVVAVDVGTDQLHASLRSNPRIDLHEKTDIRSIKKLSPLPDIILIDVSFISLREILPHISALASKSTQIIAMLKPQFEAGKEQINRGVVKNDRLRRQILKDFENWTKNLFVIEAKADSQVTGALGNLERFYLLKKL